MLVMLWRHSGAERSYHSLGVEQAAYIDGNTHAMRDTHATSINPSTLLRVISSTIIEVAINPDGALKCLRASGYASEFALIAPRNFRTR